MSTFDGLIKEIPGISVDRFDGDNLESKIYFLSHCHQDHMVGLLDNNERDIFVQQLRGKYLYLSHVSCGIFKNYFPEFEKPRLAKRLIEIDLNSSTLIEIDDGRIINCTAIPAGHCPGSVMFLFESVTHTVLYTGDYRIKPTDLGKFKGFYNSRNELKTIDKIYMDTTFFFKAYKSFPSREESIDQICYLIHEWIRKNDKNIINLSVPAKYGYEFLFMEIYKRLKYPIHVSIEKYDFYCKIPEMDHCVTTEGARTPIHSSCLNFFNICCNSTKYVRKIRVSAARWDNSSDTSTDIVTSNNDNEFFVCYSTHPSYDECVGTIKFFKPKAIEANVLPINNLDKQSELCRNIRKTLENVRNIAESDSDSD